MNGKCISDANLVCEEDTKNAMRPIATLGCNRDRAEM